MRGSQAKRKDSLFFVAIYALILLFWIGFAIKPDGRQGNVFFARTGNFLADYFNPIGYSMAPNPYAAPGDPERAYAPMAYLVFRFLGSVGGYRGAFPSLGSLSTMGLATSFIALGLFSLAFLIPLFDNAKGPKPRRYMLVGAFALSGIYLFSLERGNIILLAAACASLFIFYFDSEHRALRELSFLCLAFSASLKGYPALLGLLLIYNRKYKDAFRLCLYGIAFMFLPFVFFEGGLIHNLSSWLKNIEANNSAYFMRAFPRFGPLYFVVYLSGAWDFVAAHSHKLYVLGSLACYGACGLGLATAGFIKERWKQVALVTCAILLLPRNSALYCGLYFFPMIVLFFNAERSKLECTIGLCAFVLLLNPLQVSVGSFDLTLFLENIAVVAVFLAILAQSIIAAIHRFTTTVRGESV